MKGIRYVLDVQSAAEKFVVRFGMFAMAIILVVETLVGLLVIWDPSIQNVYIRY